MFMYSFIHLFNVYIYTQCEIFQCEYSCSKAIGKGKTLRQQVKIAKRTANTNMHAVAVAAEQFSSDLTSMEEYLVEIERLKEEAERLKEEAADRDTRHQAGQTERDRKHQQEISKLRRKLSNAKLYANTKLVSRYFMFCYVH